MKCRVVTCGASCHDFVHEQVLSYLSFLELCRPCTAFALFIWWRKPWATDRAHKMVAENGWDEPSGHLMVVATGLGELNLLLSNTDSLSRHSCDPMSICFKIGKLWTSVRIARRIYCGTTVLVVFGMYSITTHGGALVFDTVLYNDCTMELFDSNSLPQARV
jgi:hypothetical protein